MTVMNITMNYISGSMSKCKRKLYNMDSTPTVKSLNQSVYWSECHCSS